MLTKSEALAKIKELEAFVEQLDNEKRWRPEQDEEFWYVGSYGTILSAPGRLPTSSEGSYSLGNCFRTEQEAEYHKLRLQSMAERGKEPEDEKGRNIMWYWDFEEHIPEPLGYRRCFFVDYLIGNVHKTEKDCVAWYTKYGEAFEVLGRKE